ncbi:MAG: response regulator [Bryobacterales bacterium]|nr:response regulator [Bryobacterales bacterium]
MDSPSWNDRNHRILVVDDNRAIHDDIRKILAGGDAAAGLADDEEFLFGETAASTDDFDIDSAYQGQEGFALIEKSLAEQRPYALAFVDVRMPPGWDGIETIEQMWRICPALQVVVCTAYSDYSWADIRRRLGHSDNLLILKKPFDNIEVTQLAYALTKKWWVSREALARVEELDIKVAQRTQELRLAEAAFRTVFESSPIGISLSDAEGRYLRVNTAFEELLGLSGASMLGRTPVELGWFAPDTLDEVSRRLASFGCVDAFEISRAIPGRGPRTCLMWWRAVTVDRKPHMLAFLLDITDRKRMEEELERARLGAEAAARAKSDFLANMSHEIRTPLNGVLGLSSLLEEKDVAGDALSLIRLIRASGETLAKILDDVLDYSKIESGKLDLERAPFSLRESLAWGVDLFRPKAEEKHIALNLEVAEDIPDRLTGDATRIRQVLANLVSNAVKFTEQGAVSIHAELDGRGGDGAYRIRVRVRDTGIGIDAEKASRLFHAFTQLDASTTRRFGGTGLGLAICKRLVEMMGGSISVVSRPDQGSEFVFDFLAAPCPEQRRRAETAAVSDLSRLRILLAEDNRINQVVAERMLQKLGCSADLVSDGGAAVRKTEEQRYDLVLLDVMMPGVDGLEAARRIRAQGGRPRVPIVALTASATVEDREACFAAGMDGYLSKPLTLDALRAALLRWGGQQGQEADKERGSGTPELTPSGPRASGG